MCLPAKKFQQIAIIDIKSQIPGSGIQIRAVNKETDALRGEKVHNANLSISAASTPTEPAPKAVDMASCFKPARNATKF
jgi:hypothetical protein